MGKRSKGKSIRNSFIKGAENMRLPVVAKIYIVTRPGVCKERPKSQKKKEKGKRCPKNASGIK